MANTMPLSCAPQPRPVYASGSHTERLGLDRPTLCWFARWRDTDPAGRQHLARTALNRRQADALERLECNLIELGCPGAWFVAGRSTKPWSVRPGILDRLLAGLDASPECALDLARACRLPDTALAHQGALEKALTAHLRLAEEPTTRPASRAPKAASKAAPLTNNEKGLTTMAATATARQTARETIINLHAAGVINLGQKLPAGWTTKMQSETGIDAQVWRITADTLRAKLDTLPAFGSQKDVVATENGTNGHAPADPPQGAPAASSEQVPPPPLVPEPAPKPEVGMVSLPTIIGNDCGHVWFASEGEACPRCALQTQLNNAVRERNGTEAVNEVYADALSQICEQAGGDGMNWTAAGVVAVAQETLAAAEIDRQTVARLETFLGKLAQQLGVEQADQILTAVGALKMQAGHLDTAVENRNEALAQRKKYQRILEGVNEAIGGNVFEDTTPDELPELVRQKVRDLLAEILDANELLDRLGIARTVDGPPGTLRDRIAWLADQPQQPSTEVESLCAAANFMALVCKIVKRDDPERAVGVVQAYVLDNRDAHELLGEFGVDWDDGEGSPATLRQRFVWFIQEQLRAPATAVTSLAPVEPPRPTAGYQLTEEDRKAVLRAAADQGMAPSTSVEQRLARTLLLSDVLAVALR